MCSSGKFRVKAPGGTLTEFTLNTPHLLHEIIPPLPFGHLRVYIVGELALQTDANIGEKRK
jgi:hypothetical protein